MVPDEEVKVEEETQVEPAAPWVTPEVSVDPEPAPKKRAPRKKADAFPVATKKFGNEPEPEPEVKVEITTSVPEVPQLSERTRLEIQAGKRALRRHGKA